MKCTQSEILLQLAADGELTAAEQVELEAHLDGCVACRRKEAWLELLAETFETARAERDAGESGLADQVVAALEQTASRPDTGRRAASKKKKNKSKPGLLSRVARAALKRALKPGREQKKTPRDPSWMDNTLEALQPPPTSLEGFRAMRDASRAPMTGVRAAGQGVSTAVTGSVKGVRWAIDKLPGRGKS